MSELNTDATRKLEEPITDTHIKNRSAMRIEFGERSYVIFVREVHWDDIWLYSTDANLDHEMREFFLDPQEGITDAFEKAFERITDYQWELV